MGQLTFDIRRDGENHNKSSITRNNSFLGIDDVAVCPTPPSCQYTVVCTSISNSNARAPRISSVSGFCPPNRISLGFFFLSRAASFRTILVKSGGSATFGNRKEYSTKSLPSVSLNLCRTTG